MLWKACLAPSLKKLSLCRISIVVGPCGCCPGDALRLWPDGLAETIYGCREIRNGAPGAGDGVVPTGQSVPSGVWQAHLNFGCARGNGASHATHFARIFAWLCR